MHGYGLRGQPAHCHNAVAAKGKQGRDVPLPDVVPLASQATNQVTVAASNGAGLFAIGRLGRWIVILTYKKSFKHW